MDIPKPKPPTKIEREEVRKVKEVRQKERHHAPHLTQRPFAALKGLKLQEEGDA